MPRLTPEEQLQKAEQAKAKAEERLRRAQKAINERERKNDTRRKIILGAALLEFASRNEGTSKFVSQVIKAQSRPQDRAVFEGFVVPHPSNSEDE